MKPSAILATLVIVGALVAPNPALAQRAQGRDRGGPRAGAPIGRAVPRGAVRPRPGPGRLPFRDYQGYRGYRGYRGYGPGVRYNLFYGYPYNFYGSGFYGGFAYGSPWGYGYPAYWGYGYRTPYWGWGPGYADPLAMAAVPGRIYGGVRIDLPQRDAEVFVDGAYAGIVNDFDGSFQPLRLEAGPHRIDIELDGFEPVSFEVNVEPGRTITYRTRLRPLTP